MNNCPFCNPDNNDIVNTIIDSTENFLVLPSKGSLCDGYIMLVPKRHILSMCELTDSEKPELLEIIGKYRQKFKNIYGKYPIFFEHGTGRDSSKSSSSIVHAHIHIVNHKFTNEESIIKELNLQPSTPVDFLKNKNTSYISYISNDFNFYITHNFQSTSQQMRIYISKDLGHEDKFNWRECNFDSNIISTITNFKK